jgi:plastocyanin
MQANRLVSLFVITLAICISSPYVVKAGIPPPITSTAGAASVKGVVRFEGTVPKSKLISMSADPSCAKQHPSPVFAEEVMTDSKGDLQNVIVFVSEGLGDRTFDAPTEPVVVEQKGCMYMPHVLAMRANQTLHMVNDDSTSHNIHFTPANNREWNKAELPGSTMDETFSRPEIAIPVKCNIHPWMRGYIAVFKHPYFVVTGKNGSFDLTNLPPGTYMIEAWHEKLGTATQKITIGAGETKNLDFVFKSKTGV